MRKPLTRVGALVGSYVGWWLGGKIGPTAAFMMAFVGIGAGIYLSGILAERLVD
jgi:hypothetical protein